MLKWNYVTYKLPLVGPQKKNIYNDGLELSKQYKNKKI